MAVVDAWTVASSSCFCFLRSRWRRTDLFESFVELLIDMWPPPLLFCVAVLLPMLLLQMFLISWLLVLVSFSLLVSVPSVMKDAVENETD